MRRQDLEDIEDWNEHDELKDNIGEVPANNAPPPGGQVGVNIAPPLPVNPTATGGTAQISKPGSVGKAPTPLVDESKIRPLPSGAETTAPTSKPESSSTIDDPPKVETIDSAPADKEKSINAAKEALKAHHPAIDHLSAPASRIHSGTATPAEQDAKAETVAGTNTEKTEDSEGKDVAKGVEDLQVGEGTKTQEQEAKEPEESGKSVED